MRKIRADEVKVGDTHWGVRACQVWADTPHRTAIYWSDRSTSYQNNDSPITVDDKDETPVTTRVELGRINMTSVNVPDLFGKLTDFMLLYGVDLDFGVDGPWFIITGEHKHLYTDQRLNVGLDLVRDLTNKALR